jgi:glycosyltransferase involved in cell wall biosynthesis
VAVLSPGLVDETSRALPQIRSFSVLPLISHASKRHKPFESSGPAVRFGFAGRLEYLKGPLPMVHGFPMAHEKHANVELKIAGSGSQRKEIVTALRNHGLEEKCEFTVCTRR